MFALRNKAGLTEDIIVQSILNNTIDENKNNYIFHLRNNFNFTELINLIESTKPKTFEEIAEFDEIAKPTINNDRNDIIQSIENLTLTIYNFAKRKEQLLKNNIICRHCKRSRHISSQCYFNNNPNFTNKNTYKKITRTKIIPMITINSHSSKNY